jgi:choline dehydrogenase-like flavoprotein
MAAETLGLEGRRLAGIVQAMVRAGEVGFFSHHMGTTRMGEGPTEGVGDREGQVFGISNLFVAGSSVFPTGGTAGPTLTIVALALRLAHRLRQRHW